MKIINILKDRSRVGDSVIDFLKSTSTPMRVSRFRDAIKIFLHKMPNFYAEHLLLTTNQHLQFRRQQSRHVQRRLFISLLNSLKSNFHCRIFTVIPIFLACFFFDFL